MTRFPDPAQSRAVLIGSSKFSEADGLPSIPAVSANLEGLKAALTSSTTGSLNSERCTLLSDPLTTSDIGQALAQSAEATDVLFVYYSGHGLVDERGRLYLALSSTKPDQLRWTALPFDALREELAASPASIRILVLDCCFSGRAVEAMSDSHGAITGQIDIAGTYTMTSTTANATSYAPAGAKYTAFTDALLGALKDQESLTLDEVFREVELRLISRGLPRPQRRAINAAGNLILTKSLRTVARRSIGEVSKVQPGHRFSTRRQAHDAGVHRPLQAGICGTRKTGAESIVISGGYKDDEDHGDVIIYTGHGGQDQAGNQVSDQSLDDSGNAALVTSCLEGLPVRVIRGWQSTSVYAPSKGYRYDGLYRVTSYGSKSSLDGFLIWQFRLEACEGTPLPKTQQQDSLGDLTEHAVKRTNARQKSDGNDKFERVITTVQRIVRSNSMHRQVKEWHDNRCQICSVRIEVPGGSYSEGAHIQALESPHNGPDAAGNVLCLCPNCHVMLDSGAIVLNDDLSVIRAGQEVGILNTHPQHIIDLECVKQHRNRWRE
ncbi:caspase, EACC1-associated type [Streptomyces pinistramenti]|uniref:caspase, EACC1-associated type n=1 Tax=Streptomyces pinistramenti TaxID=2884812 RepID=UPI001D06CF05|nr:YDG/SRA domain-containing protein [Streptomyces pinistramenti]MCB5910141.1 caspase family protein [Streptomyces pinistramenti]